MVTPFREEQPRLPYQTSTRPGRRGVCRSRAAGFSWSVHRRAYFDRLYGRNQNELRHVGAYAATARNRTARSSFQARHRQYEPFVDITDGRIIPSICLGGDEAGCPEQRLHIVNGDLFRWNWMWPKLAEHLGFRPLNIPVTRSRWSNRWRRIEAVMGTRSSPSKACRKEPPQRGCIMVA